MIRKLNENQPLYWILLVGFTCAAVIGCVGFFRGGVEDALVGGFVTGVMGCMLGFVIWIFLRLVAGVDGQNVRRPDKWGIPLCCNRCGWETTPEGPWTLKDVAFPKKWCPECANGLRHKLPECPSCGSSAKPVSFRIPTSSQQAMWGGYNCHDCGTRYDKWGRRFDEINERDVRNA